MTTTSTIRHNWVEEALRAFRAHFLDCGYDTPDNIRVSVGFTLGNHAGKKALGQCIDYRLSSDGHYELFISPEVGLKGEVEIDYRATVNLLETVAHELIHATVGSDQGHQGKFIDCARAVGFNRPWRYTPAGERMMEVITAIIAQQGLFPTGSININARKKKQGKSLLKCQCECGFTAYVTAKNYEEVGSPICPSDFVAMECQ